MARRRRQREETFGDALLRFAFSLLGWWGSVLIAVYATNVYLDASSVGRVTMGLVILAAALVLIGVIAYAVIRAQKVNEWKELARTAVENPARTTYQLGGLKSAIEEWRTEPLADEAFNAPEVRENGNPL